MCAGPLRRDEQKNVQWSCTNSDETIWAGTTLGTIEYGGDTFYAACTKMLWIGPAVTEPIVRLVYERTAAPGVDAGVEPLIAVCSTEEEAERIEAESSARDRYASWEKHPLQGAEGRTTPPADGEIVHVVLLGGGKEPDDPDRDPIGVAVYTRREAAERRASEERQRSSDPGYHATSLPIRWRADH